MCGPNACSTPEDHKMAADHLELELQVLVSCQLLIAPVISPSLSSPPPAGWGWGGVDGGRMGWDGGEVG